MTPRILRGGGVQFHAQTALPPMKEPPVSIEYEIVWTQKHVWTHWIKLSYFCRGSNPDPRSYRPQPIHCTNYARRQNLKQHIRISPSFVSSY